MTVAAVAGSSLAIAGVVGLGIGVGLVVGVAVARWIRRYLDRDP